MAKVSMIISKRDNGKKSDQMMMYDPLPKGYGGGHETFNYGVQQSHIGGYSGLYYLADHEITYRTCRQILKMYHFKEGLEFTNQIKNQDTVRSILKFFECVNANKQTFLDILFELEDDFNIADDAYLCLNRNYIVDKETGDIIYSEIKELYRGNPIYYKIVSGDNTRLGGVYSRCLVCEAIMHENPAYKDYVANFASRYKNRWVQNVVFLNTSCQFNSYRQQYICPICGAGMHDVKYVVSRSPDSIEPAFFHIDKEVIHASKYSPSLLYGTSPIVTVFNQLDTKIKFGQYIQSFLDYNRAPQGVIFINTSNSEQVKMELEKATAKLSMDRYYTPIMAIDSQSNGTIAQYIQLTPFPEELKQLEIEANLRREIAALLGVQNVMLNDLEGVGGLNSESLQVQVTDRAALAGQIVYNTKLFPSLMFLLGEYGQFDIGSDLSLIVKRTDNAENEIRMVNLERTINLALAIQELGYEAEPDFANLIGYDNKKLLPFTFRKLSREEIQRNNEVGLGTDTPEKVTTPSSPSRAKIPAFRTKQLLLGDYEPSGVLYDSAVDENGKMVIKTMYRINYTDYEFGYITDDQWDKISMIRKSLRYRDEEDKKMKELGLKISKVMSKASEGLKRVLMTASMMYSKDNIEDSYISDVNDVDNVIITKNRDIDYSSYIDRAVEVICDVGA